MLSRAKHHVADLEAKINSFVQDKPWTPVIEVDVDGFTQLHKIKFTKSLSEDIPNVIFDAANNLRSALDQAAFQIAVRHTGNSAPTSARFPIGPTEAKMLNTLAGGCKDLPPEIRSVFRAFHPYKGRNDTLWALNELCNFPKHKILVPIQLTRGTFTVSDAVMRGRRLGTFTWEWDREKNEVIWLRSEMEGTYNLDFTVGVAFDNTIELIGGHAPVAVLNTMARVVESVLMATEAECRRIGLIN